MTKREKQLVEALRKMAYLAQFAALLSAQDRDDISNAAQLLKQYDTKEKKHEAK